MARQNKRYEKIGVIRHKLESARRQTVNHKFKEAPPHVQEQTHRWVKHWENMLEHRNGVLARRAENRKNLAEAREYAELQAKEAAEKKQEALIAEATA